MFSKFLPRPFNWGYFSKMVAPALIVKSGDRATIETLTHHANDDYERMVRMIQVPSQSLLGQVITKLYGGVALGRSRVPSKKVREKVWACIC